MKNVLIMTGMMQSNFDHLPTFILKEMGPAVTADDTAHQIVTF
jgi:hypothetical protein